MSDLESLRAAVERATGPARVKPLTELSQALVQHYLDAGPGRPAAGPLLDEAIDVVQEAYQYFGPADAMRLQLTAMRGWLYGTRHIAHGSPPQDRTTGIADLEEGLRSPHLPPASLAVYRMTLGQLYLAEVTTVLRSPDMTSMIVNGTLPASMDEDVERAVGCFETILAAPTLAREVQEAARIQLRVAKAMRAMAEGARSTDPVERMDRIMSAMAAFQEIHKEQSRLAQLGPDGPVRSIYFAEQIVARDPLDRPTTLIEVDDPAGTRSPATVPATPAAPATGGGDVAVLRRRLRQRLAAGGDLVEALEALLDPAAAAPPAAAVDEVVALATAVADTGAANRTDDLLLAAGLVLRAARGGDDLDLDDAADALARSAGGRRVVPPDVLRVMRRLASMIDAAGPGRRTADRLAAALP
jgi:hypothetical protein